MARPTSDRAQLSTRDIQLELLARELEDLGIEAQNWSSLMRQGASTVAVSSLAKWTEERVTTRQSTIRRIINLLGQ